MANDLINPKDCPVNSRWLVRDYEYRGTVYEITIVEWSPSGKRVLLHYRSGTSNWCDDLPFKVEELPAQINPAIEEKVYDQTLS